MKISHFSMLLIVTLTLLSLIKCEKDNDIILDNVPTKIQSYLYIHFPNHDILSVVKKIDTSIITFEVSLAGDIKLNFNEAKEIIEIDSSGEFSTSVIPVMKRE